MQRSKNRKNGLLHFLGGCLAIYLFIFQLVPFFTAWGKTAEVINYINENDIDVTPLFYTESEEAGAAVFLIRKKTESEINN